MDEDLARRIDDAIDRIERAAAARGEQAAAMERRHAALRERMGEAVRALDDLIARGEN